MSVSSGSDVHQYYSNIFLKYNIDLFEDIEKKSKLLQFKVSKR